MHFEVKFLFIQLTVELVGKKERKEEVSKLSDLRRLREHSLTEISPVMRLGKRHLLLLTAG